MTNSPYNSDEFDEYFMCVLMQFIIGKLALHMWLTFDYWQFSAAL